MSTSRRSPGLTTLAVSLILGAALAFGIPTPAILVTTGFGTPFPVVATVWVGWAVVALGVVSAVAHLAPPERVRTAAASQVAGIVVFLVALLNGIRDVTALVPLFALAAGASLLRDAATGATRRRDVYSIAAGIGIVPWGVIAWAQIGTLVTGGDVAIATRVGTVVLLALSALPWVAAWRGRGDRGTFDQAVVAALAVLAVLLGAAPAG